MKKNNIKKISRIALLVLGGIMLFGLWGCSKKNGNDNDTDKVTAKVLIRYRETAAGGMNGGHSNLEIWASGDDAYITYDSANWYNEDSHISEYKINKQVLADISEIYTKYKMKKWEGKEFSDIFVSDGESYGYSFVFEGGENTSFSSQVYDDKYSKKLAEIDEVIKKYKETAEKMPGLVTVELTEEELFEGDDLSDGEITLQAYEYSRNRLYYRLKNGTDETVTTGESAYIYKAEGGDAIVQKEADDTIEAYAHEIYEHTLTTDGFLEVGTYRLQVGDYSCEFEISE